jgi:eukaryotic-like serine/threonine-protein kinase
MSDDMQIERLLEDLLDSGQTPEEACRDWPNLLPAVRRRLLQFQEVKQRLQILFPPSSGDGQTARRFPTGRLPTIADYAVESLLGRGGMGVVYKARHLKLNRHVALKMLLSGVYASSAELARFQREAWAVAGLRHENIVQVHDFGDCEGRPYFTMELLEGGTLGETLGGVPQPPKKAAETTAVLAEAIQAAHGAGIVHRDLKPGNILLSSTGVLKIADFGLARRVNTDDELTLSGARLGTLTHMAPEQALGEQRKIGPATDIYSLGVLLYEMLTGRPPFLAESDVEMQRRLISDDPVPPSRLNPKVPRDLQTICLKCLHKEIDRRYETASELADDLHRFLRGDAILARPVGPAERLTKWVRRRPAMTTAIAISFLFATSVLVGACWLQRQREERRAGAENDLRLMTSLEDGGRWKEAGVALQRAEARVGSNDFDGMRAEIDGAKHDLALVIRLDDIRLRRVSAGDLNYYRAQASQDYQDAFASAGLGKLTELPQTVGARIAASPTRVPLLAAVDDWTVSATALSQRRWLLQVGQTAAPGETWRKALNDSSSWWNKKNLEQLAGGIPVNDASITLLLAMSARTRAGTEGISPYLWQIQKLYPDNFWANLVLGNALLQQDPTAAESYYRAALAGRSDVAIGFEAVGDSLRLQRKYAAAVEYYQKALSLEPNYPRGISNLAGALVGLGRPGEAITHYKQALRLDQNYAWAHFGLGNALRDTNQLSEAAKEYQLFIAARGATSDAVNDLRRVQIRQGHIDQVWTDWQTLIARDSKRYGDWSGAAELALFLNDSNKYEQIRATLLDHFGGDQSLESELVRSCLLRPASKHQTQILVAMADRSSALSADGFARSRGIDNFVQGLAMYRTGKWDRAVSVLNGEIDRSFQTSSRFIIAMALMQKQEPAEARQVFSDAVASYDWSPANADRREVWMCHILRREAEKIILTASTQSIAGPTSLNASARSGGI